MMGDLCAAAVLLAATLKLDGSKVLQVHGKGAVKLLVGDGRFVITLDPKDGGQAYQGIVPLEVDSVANILRMIGREEVDCEFCNERYVFDSVDADAVFAEVPAVSANKTLH